MWDRVWQVDSVQQTFVKAAMDSAGSVQASLGYLLPVQSFRKTMNREDQKGTTLIIQCPEMPTYLGLGGNHEDMGCLSRVGSQSCQLFSLLRTRLSLSVSLLSQLLSQDTPRA